MATFKLSASFEGHDDDVRAVTFIKPNTVLSASRDASVRLWKIKSTKPHLFDGRIVSQGKDFINSLTYLPPNSDYPDGLIFSGARDAIIEARKPGTAIDSSAEALLIGHAGNVCALDVSVEGGFLVSGSWDCSAKIWRLGKWEADVTLEGHQGSVWGVLAYDSRTIITACADKMIRVFDVTGKLKQTIGGSQDVVRALCKLPSGHPSGAHFASAGNDAVIRLWTLQGQLVAEHHGHQSFIYSLAVLPSGELVSSGEDRTVRVWAGANCIQTITHPAISVWSVAACKETGDIVSGASDRTVRVFSRTPERHADEAVSQRFEKSVQESAIPQQQVGNINKDNLPGPEFLQQKLGTKDGQVQMIREANGSVSAYTWSSATNEWVNVGTVVDSVGSSGRKTEYMGQDYDYVFDVDIEDGAPPLKLPYNLSQNPYQVAQKFIADNELPISYIDQVTQFIINNTQGQSLDQTAGASAAPQTTTAPAPPRPKVLPQKTYLSIKTANLQVIYKKIQEINSKLESEGNKEATLNPSEIDVLGGLVEELGKPEPLEKSEGLKLGIQLAAKIATAWPVANRIPGLDLLRLLASASPLTATADYSGADLIPFLLGSGAFDEPVKPNHAMLIVRTFANLFESEEGRNLVSKYQDSLFTCISGLMDKSEASSNRNLVIAATTLLINMSVWITSGDKTSDPSASDHALQMLDILSRIPFIGKDSEAVYRALVAFGTLVVVCGGEVKQAAKDVFDIDSVLSKILADDIGREPRIQGVTSEIREALR